jgi:hypothetical protein
MIYILRAIVIIIVVGAIVIGTQIYGYSSLKTDFSATDVSPKFNISTKSIVTGLLSVFQRNLLGAVSNFVQGLQVNGTLTLKNDSFLPLYLASMQHKIEINGTPTQSAISTSAMWIAPWGLKTEPFSILIAKADLSTVALNILGSGGNVNISVESSAVLAGFTITKTHKNKRM